MDDDIGTASLSLAPAAAPTGDSFATRINALSRIILLLVKAWLGRPAVLPALRQREVQLLAGTDSKLGKYLAQVPFDRARGQEQLCADLQVSAAVAGQPGDLLLLRRELAVRRGAALAHLLAR